MAEGHGGNHAVAVARAHGIETMFTLSGAHVFPMYDAAVKGDQPMRLVDVRHEQTAVFAAAPPAPPGHPAARTASTSPNRSSRHG